jgi:Sec-independent protein translocase protein TatA
MPSIGFFELLLIALVAVLALKPAQLKQSIQTFRRSLLKVRQYTSQLEQEILAEEKQIALQHRIEAASKVSDVSDLLPGPSDESKRQP